MGAAFKHTTLWNASGYRSGISLPKHNINHSWGNCQIQDQHLGGDILLVLVEDPDKIDGTEKACLSLYFYLLSMREQLLVILL